MKEGLSNYTDWIAKQPDQKKANETIHQTVVAVMSPKFKKFDYRTAEYDHEAGDYKKSEEEKARESLHRTIPANLQLWDEHRIGIIDHHESEETSAVAQLYLSYINSIIEPLGVQFEENDLQKIAKAMKFHNGRHSFQGTDILIHEREYDPIHHKPLFPKNQS